MSSLSVTSVDVRTVEDASLPSPDTVLDWLANPHGAQASASLKAFSQSPGIGTYFELVSAGRLSVHKLAAVLAGLHHQFGRAEQTPSWTLSDPNSVLIPYAQLAAIQGQERECVWLAFRFGLCGPLDRLLTRVNFLVSCSIAAVPAACQGYYACFTPVFAMCNQFIWQR